MFGPFWSSRDRKEHFRDMEKSKLDQMSQSQPKTQLQQKSGRMLEAQASRHQLDAALNAMDQYCSVETLLPTSQHQKYAGGEILHPTSRCHMRVCTFFASASRYCAQCLNALASTIKPSFPCQDFRISSIRLISHFFTI